jgi:hypothetical protein
MPISVSVTAAKRNGKGGFYVQFSDNTEREYESRRQARQELAGMLNESPEVVEFLKSIAVVRALRATADGDDADDLESLVGRTFTFARKAANNIVRVT